MSLATEPNTAGIHARIAEAYADEDARRTAWLDLVVKQGGTCRTCGATVADRFISLHPGACATCMKRGRGQPYTFTAFAVETSAPTTEEIPMPCSVCGKPGHNARGCSKRADPKPTTPPAAEPARPAKVAPLRRPPPSPRAHPELAGQSLEQLLAARKAAVETVNQVDAELVRRRDEIQRALGQLDLREGEA